MSSTSTTYRGEFSTQTPSFAHQCDTILEQFQESNDVLKAGRNTLKKITIDNTPCVVKAFRIPSFPQNYCYGTLAKSKAKKSYLNAHKLLNLGFSTPNPIGYFEHQSNAKLKSSYYISEYAQNTQTLHQLLEKDQQLDPQLIKQFSIFCHNLHKKGILHRDFNPKNILTSHNQTSIEFSLVDINRITWSGPLSLKTSMSSLSRLPFSEPTKTAILEHYTDLANVDLRQCQILLHKSKQKTQRYFRNKKRLRKFFPKK